MLYKRDANQNTLLQAGKFTGLYYFSTFAHMKNLLAGGICLALFAACSTPHKTPSGDVASLQLLHKYTVPYNQPYNGTTIGGLSGIDYDTAHKVFYMICDDRSQINPARFYTAHIPLAVNTKEDVTFTAVTSLRMPGGDVYPAEKHVAPDPESMRYNPHNGHLYWTSEGERIVTAKDTILNNPAITEMTTDGHFIDSFPLPAQFRMQVTNNGPRRNGTFEGIGFTPDGRYLFVNLEEPRYEDGPRAGLKDNNAYIRILKYDVRTRKPVAQYAYKLEPIAQPPVPADSFSINGISDILVLSETKLLAMERSFSFGVKNNTIRIFTVDLSKATNINNVSSLQDDTHFTPATKNLLINFDTLNTYIDNVEGMTFGPTLPNGHRSLVCVADNNFTQSEETQFFIFEIK